MIVTSYRFSICVFLLASVVMAKPNYANPVVSDKNEVLVVHSYHKGFTWTDNVDKGLNQSFKVLSEFKNAEVYFEYLDSKRNISQPYLDALVVAWQEKYRDCKLKVIITSDDDAFRLVMKIRAQVFGPVPLVFCGVNNLKSYQGTLLLNEKNYTGVVEGFDLNLTLNAAFKMFPSTKTVYVVNDTSATGKANKKAFELAWEKYSSQIELQFKENFSMINAPKWLSKLPQNSFVVLLTYNTDSLGYYYDYETAGTIISHSANVPVFVVWDFYMGTGVFGGNVVSGIEQGRTAAELAHQILLGKPVDSIPVVTYSPNKYMFDYLQIEKFNADLRLLPTEAELVNKPVSIIEKHKTEVVALGIAFAILTISIIVLVFINRKKTRAERSLIVSKNKILAIIENANDGFAEIDKNNLIVYSNNVFCNIFEIACRDTHNKPITDLVPLHLANPLSIAIDQCRVNGLNSMEVLLPLLSGAEKYLVFNFTLSPVEFNRASEDIFVFITDISHIKLNEKELILAKEKAEASDKLKSAFLANMSHEIRTPMNAILGFSELLSDPDIDENSRMAYISTIQSSGHVLMALINDILDISKIAAGQLNIYMNKVEIEPVLNNVYLTFFEYRKTIGKEHIGFVMESCSETLCIVTDAFRLNQIISNLVNNAFKFTDKGIITFGCKITGINELQFYVTDTGIGLPKGMEKFVFERFMKIENISNQVYRGAGLGLSISKNLVELLGGEIHCESEEGRGSKFYFTIKGEIITT